jgi:hypothetical protein
MSSLLSGRVQAVLRFASFFGAAFITSIALGFFARAEAQVSCSDVPVNNWALYNADTGACSVSSSQPSFAGVNGFVFLNSLDANGAGSGFLVTAELENGSPTPLTISGLSCVGAGCQSPAFANDSTTTRMRCSYSAGQCAFSGSYDDDGTAISLSLTVQSSSSTISSANNQMSGGGF